MSLYVIFLLVLTIVAHCLNWYTDFDASKNTPDNDFNLEQNDESTVTKKKVGNPKLRVNKNQKIATDRKGIQSAKYSNLKGFDNVPLKSCQTYQEIRKYFRQLITYHHVLCFFPLLAGNTTAIDWNYLDRKLSGIRFQSTYDCIHEKLEVILEIQRILHYSCIEYRHWGTILKHYLIKTKRILLKKEMSNCVEYDQVITCIFAEDDLTAYYEEKKQEALTFPNIENGESKYHYYIEWMRKVHYFRFLEEKEIVEKIKMHIEDNNLLWIATTDFQNITSFYALYFFILPFFLDYSFFSFRKWIQQTKWGSILHAYQSNKKGNKKVIKCSEDSDPPPKYEK